MVATMYRGVVKDGQIVLEGGESLPDGTRVFVRLVTEQESAVISAHDLLNAEFIGEWADRDDIGDTAEFAERLRQQSNRRESDG